MKEILQRLVSLPTVSGNYTASQEALDYISDFLVERGMHIKRYNWHNFESIVATVYPTKTPKVMLAAHVDVVPGDISLFKLREENGRLYGRGTFDMKFAIATYMQLIDDIKDGLDHYDLGIMITTDEEVAGDNGTKKLLEEGYRPHVFVLPDGGGDWSVETFAQGMLWAKLTANGKTAHGSRPWEGESALTKLINMLHVLQNDTFKDQNAATSTLNISLIKSGNAPNQIPDEASAHLDIRTVNKKDHDRITDTLAKLARKHGINIEVLASDYPCITDVNDPYVKSFFESITTITGHPASTTRSFGASDARHIARYNIPFIIVEPHGGGRHSEEEWIDAKGFEQFKDVLHHYVDRVARTKAPVARPKLLTTAQ